MPDLHLQVLSLAQVLETTPDGSEQFLHELLFFPEFRSFGNVLEKMPGVARKMAIQVVREGSLDRLHGRQPPESVSASVLELRVEPAPRSGVLWTSPVDLSLPMIQWEHGDATLAYIPALGIEVWTERQEDLKAAIQDQAKFALRRAGVAKSLLELAKVQRGRSLKLEKLAWNALAETPVDRYERTYGEHEKADKVLESAAKRLHPCDMPQAYERDMEVMRLSQWLGGKRGGCVLLVGRPGVGKTAIIKETIRLGQAFTRGVRAFWQTSGSRLVAGQTGAGMWQERCLKMVKELKSKGDALNLGNLYELMQVGQSNSNSESIASFLRPSMVSGDLVAVAECTPQQLAAIETQDPKLLDAFRVLKVDEPNKAMSRQILEQVAGKSWILAEAMDRLDALHRRYATYSAYPGRPLRFLQRLRPSAQEVAPEMVTEAAVIAAFSEETGLPRWLLDDAEVFAKEQVRQWFTERVQAQGQAVDAVIDNLMKIKTRLARPGKPLGSFIFLGPTGVGKTELAKTLTEFLYQSRERMIRFDMSEFHSPATASRLVSDSFSGGEGLLTAAVRDQPFSVILLDEFEKATPKIFDLFLQVLGEGRLTDGAGRLADFSNAVVIMTSNLGAATFKQGALGFGGQEAGKESSHFVEALKAAVRPEFFNRIDSIVPFASLSREAVRGIAERELSLVEMREGFRDRRLTLQVDQALLDAVVTAGYDPRYGARPLKRMMERRLLLPVSEFLNAKPRENGSLQLSGDEETVVTFTPEAEVRTDSDHAMRRLMSKLSEAGNRRREMRRLDQSSLCAELRSQAQRLARSKAHAERRQSKKGAGAFIFEPVLEAQAKKLRELLGQVASKLETIQVYEENCLLALYHDPAASIGSESVPVSRSAYQETLIDVYKAFSLPKAEFTLLLQSDAHDWLVQLCQSYAKLAEPWLVHPIEVGTFAKKPGREERVEPEEEGNEVRVKPVVSVGEEAVQVLGSLSGEVAAVALRFRGVDAAMRFAHEEGLHVRERSNDRTWRCLVRVLEDPLAAVTLPLPVVERVPDLTRETVRRVFKDKEPASYRDVWLGERGRGTFSQSFLSEVIERTLIQEIERAL